MIKYCIWDVGQVIYEYSLSPLHNWCRIMTKNSHPSTLPIGLFSFDAYMAGFCDFSTMCRELCAFYEIDYKSSNDEVINRLLHAGVGNFIAETAEMRRCLSEQGISNGVLSNALPCLADTLTCDDVDRRYVFTSYQWHLLKPDLRIFQRLAVELDCLPQQIIFVDDKPENIQAAKFVGIHGICFRRDDLKKELSKLVAWPK